MFLTPSPPQYHHTNIILRSQTVLRRLHSVSSSCFSRRLRRRGSTLFFFLLPVRVIPKSSVFCFLSPSRVLSYVVSARIRMSKQVAALVACDWWRIWILGTLREFFFPCCPRETNSLPSPTLRFIPAPINELPTTHLTYKQKCKPSPPPTSSPPPGSSTAPRSPSP